MWLIDVDVRTVERLLRRGAGGSKSVERLTDGDVLRSELLPGFSMQVAAVSAR